MLETKTVQYIADVYLRISKEDGDKEESDSIANQRELILDFLKSMPDIRVHKVKKDDGYSGVNFNRPAFNEMMEDIKSGAVNCVIVKDFSRFGRNYIEAGKYIQVLFPKIGVRFIAVNDRYDSLKTNGYADSIIVPFKNMVNDAYCADISLKTRSQLDVKRKRGDFIGSFAVYGYLKSDEDKNRLVIDDYAAEVVRDIFKWKLEGMSQQGIADRLNERGVLSPMEHKRFMGLRYSTTFKVNGKALWSAVAVGRILKNEVYLGVLEQGKRVTPNYKVKKRVDIPKSDWARVENSHDAIIEKSVFDTVQLLLKMDTRTAAKSQPVYPFTGIILCGDCKRNMVRKTIPKGDKKYYYFTCSKHRDDKTACKPHSISEPACENAVFTAVQTHIATTLDMERALRCIDSLPYQQAEIRKLDAQIESKQDEVKRYSTIRLSLHEDYRDGIITKDDFISFKQSYDEKIRDAEQAILLQKEEIERIAAGKAENNAWIEKFKEYRDIDSLNRKIVAELIENIFVYEGNRIEITFRYQNEFERLLSFLNRLAVAGADNGAPARAQRSGSRRERRSDEVERMPAARRAQRSAVRDDDEAV